MGQPTPPGDMPLFDGLGTEWNDIVGALPEDRRNELAPRIKERLDQYEPLKAYEDFHKSGIDPDHVRTALSVFSMIENNPRQVYDVIADNLGLTKQEAKEVVEEFEEATDDDPRIKTLQQQVDVLTQIALAKRQQETESELNAQAEASINKELDALKKKYSDVDEEEVVMRMVHGNMTAEQAYQAYAQKVESIRKTRPAPMLIGGGGAVPRKEIDVTKLDTKDTKSLVAQMMQQGLQQR